MKCLRLASVLIFVLISSVAAYSQAEDLTLGAGVERHKGIDQIYTDFTTSYRTLDSELLAGLYSNNASYLSPNSPIVSGRDQIKKSFTGFFERIKERNQSMTIAFHIKTRKISMNLGYDVGTFEIKFSENGKIVNTSTGKFVVVTELGADGRWRFAVDGYSGLETPN